MDTTIDLKRKRALAHISDAIRAIAEGNTDTNIIAAINRSLSAMEDTL